MRMVPAPKVAPLAQRLTAAETDTGPTVPVTLWPATQLTAEAISARAEALPFSHIQDRIGLRGLQPDPDGAGRLRRRWLAAAVAVLWL